jgi:hypothetical protein
MTKWKGFGRKQSFFDCGSTLVFQQQEVMRVSIPGDIRTVHLANICEFLML